MAEQRSFLWSLLCSSLCTGPLAMIPIPWLSVSCISQSSHHVVWGACHAYLAGLVLLCGVFINGPYAVITTAVSNDLVHFASVFGTCTCIWTLNGISALLNTLFFWQAIHCTCMYIHICTYSNMLCTLCGLVIMSKAPVYNTNMPQFVHVYDTCTCVYIHIIWIRQGTRLCGHCL